MIVFPVSLTTERLILREFVEDDWQATLAYQSNPLYLRYYAWTQRTETDVRKFIDTFLDQQAQQPRRKFQLALVLKSNGRLVGSGGIRVNNAEAREANVGYELDPDFWGKGLATEAARELLRFGFEELEMQRIFGECVTENIASARIMEKIGMQQNAHLGGSTWFKDRWWATRIYAIQKDEWDASCSSLP